MQHSSFRQICCSVSTLSRFSSNFSTAASAGHDDEYQFLEKSVLPTMYFQKSLPRLPIPKLEDTCRRYLNGVRPIFSPEQYAQTERIVKSFEENEGKDLHQRLVNHDKANAHTSYISEPWFNMYLADRKPVVINSNPFMALEYDPVQKYNDQAVRATNLIVAALRFKRSMDALVLRPEVFHMNPKKSDTDLWRSVMRMSPSMLATYISYAFKAFPLDMSQHPSLFGTSRVPKRGKDVLTRHPDSGHILILRKGHFFALKCLNADGSILTPVEICAGIRRIKSLSLAPPRHPIGVLTTENRDTWASVRDGLLEAGNADALHKVDTALFCICLDDESTKDPPTLIRTLLHGDGVNRWFDKSFSLLMLEDGLTCVNFEHSWGDGVAVLRLMEDVFRDSNQGHFVAPETDTTRVDAGAVVEEIKFTLNPALESSITTAMANFRAVTGSLDFATLEYYDMNKNTIKANKLSPDAVMQLAIQLAYFRQTNGFTATYESCSTSAFKHGRTETMRPATEPTREFVTRFLAGDGRPSNAELRSMIEACSKRHFELVKEASMGQGFDRHLFGMRHIAEQSSSGQLPPLFADPGYSTANHFVLSTSTLSTDTVILGGFGPVVPDGYGIGYNVGSKRLGGVVSSYRDARDGPGFVDALKQSLDDIRDVLSSGGE